MRNLRMLTVVLLLASPATGCGGDDDEAELPEVDCDTGAVPDYEDVSAFDTCTNCHDSSKTGAARAGAEEGVNFDTEAAAQKSAMEAAHEVYEGEMPPKGAGTLTEAQKEQLYRWALCSD
jgi:uncharacterized membrane protein